MKRLLFVVALLACVSASAQKKFAKFTKFKYTFALEKPTPSDSLKYADQILSITFDPNTKGVDFKIKNLTSEILKVKWDDATLIVNGETKKTIHKGVKLIDRSLSQPMGIIPPGAILDDFVWPSENVRLSQGLYGGDWKVDDMLYSNNRGLTAEHEKALALKGKKIGLYLPVIKSDKQNDYFFEFTILDVIETK